MNITHIQMRNNQTQFSPGEQVVGVAVWQLDAPPRFAAVRLFWYTEGKGTRDVGVSSEERMEDPPAVGKIEFSFTAPALPHSYEGRLISFLWAIELEIPKATPARQPLEISPTAQTLRLG